jgi:flagellar hook protein FlgE
MLRSLSSGISGLQSFQQRLDVIGNNIANVNTTGFKASRTTFSESLAQTVRGGGLPTAAQGGTNPLQIGLGTRVAGVVGSFTQGALQLTGRQTDLAIQGDGFFAVDRGGQLLLTRSGAFNWDASGTLVTNDGARVQGWSADPVTGLLPTGGPTGAITIPTGPLAPVATTSAVLSANVPASTVVGGKASTTAVFYDSLGTAHDMTISLTKLAAPGTWTAQVTYKDSTGATVDITPGPAPTITFDSAGAIVSPTSFTMTGVAFGNAAPQNVTLQMGDAQHPLTQYDRAQTMDVPVRNGSAGAELTSVTFGADGTVNGLYSNGESKILGVVAMADVTNREGLLRMGDDTFATSLTSGEPAYGVPGAGRLGTLAPGTLEGSNVDLANEFTNLVLAQRGFQANSRVISTSDEMLGDLVNIKR